MPAKIDFECPHCGHSMHAHASAAGKSGQCKSCMGTVTVPQPTKLTKPKQPELIVRSHDQPQLMIPDGATHVTIKSPAVHVTMTAPKTPSNSFGIASMVLGFLAFIVCWIPVVGLTTMPAAIVGLVLGVIACRKRSDRMGFGIAGVTLCTMSLTAGFIVQGALMWLMFYIKGIVNGTTDRVIQGAKDVVTEIRKPVEQQQPTPAADAPKKAN